MRTIDVDEENGVDGDDATGTQTLPFNSLLQAFACHGADDEYLVKKKGEEAYKPAARAAWKKAASYAET